MFGWQKLGPKWLTNEVFQVLELLNEQHIPCRMPSDDTFIFNFFSPAHPGLRWEIRVRRRDRERAIALLEREGLLSRSRLETGKPE